MKPRDDQSTETAPEEKISQPAMEEPRIENPIAFKKRKLRLNFPEVLSVTEDSEKPKGPTEKETPAEKKSPMKPPTSLLLTSPDLSALSMSSPDLEQYILRAFPRMSPISPSVKKVDTAPGEKVDITTPSPTGLEGFQTIPVPEGLLSSIQLPNGLPPGIQIAISPTADGGYIAQPFAAQFPVYAQQAHPVMSAPFPGAFPQILLQTSSVSMPLSGPVQFVPLSAEAIFNQPSAQKAPTTAADPPTVEPPTSVHPAFPPPYQPQNKKRRQYRSSSSPAPSPASGSSDCVQKVPGPASLEDSSDVQSVNDSRRRRRRPTDSNNEESDQSEMFGDKSDRKRERNRLAAAKCRQKKMDRIAELEEKVSAQKLEIEILTQAAERSKAELTKIRQDLRSHMIGGCMLELPAERRRDLGIDQD